MQSGKERITSIGRILFFIKILFLLFLIISCTPQISVSGEEANLIKIKEVINHDNVKHISDYEYGKYRYPYYKIEGLSDSFLIKKSADIILYPKDITSVKISNMYNTPQKIDAYWVKISFTLAGSKKMKNYTLRKIDERIALEINDTLFVIAKVLSPIENEVSMPIIDKSITELKDILKKVTKEIIVVE